MKNFKTVILISIILPVILALVTFFVPHMDWAFLPYLVLSGCFFVWVQKENKSFKFLDKLLVGSFIFGFLATIFIFLKIYLFSHLVYNTPLPIRELWDKDTFILSLVYVFLCFLGGLLGIVLKGLYSLYEQKLNWIIIFIGPLLAVIASLAVFKIKLGGTIMSGYYGLPYSYFTYQVKDIVDGFRIDKWIFSPGSFYHYVIFNYLVYSALFVLAFYAIKLINKKLTAKKLNSVISLFGLLVLMIIVFTSFLPVKQSYLSYQIALAGYCEESSDCVIIADKCPFSCAVVVNKNSAGRINNLINAFPSTCELNCSGREKAVCLQNKCQISVDQTSNETYWEILKQALADCEVSSIMQTHSLEVTAVLKNKTIIKAQEPEIDDVFEIIAANKKKCGEIIMATE